MCYGNVQHIVVSTSWSTGDVGDKLEHFQSLGSFKKVFFVLGSELREHKCHSTLDRVIY